MCGVGYKYLDERIVPAIPYQNRLQMYLVRAMHILIVLALDVFIEDGPIVTSIAL